MEKILDMIKKIERNTEKIRQLTGSLEECAKGNVNVMTIDIVVKLALATSLEYLQLMEELMSELRNNNCDKVLLYYSDYTMKTNLVAQYRMSEAMEKLGG